MNNFSVQICTCFYCMLFIKTLCSAVVCMNSASSSSSHSPCKFCGRGPVNGTCCLKAYRVGGYLAARCRLCLLPARTHSCCHTERAQKYITCHHLCVVGKKSKDGRNEGFLFYCCLLLLSSTPSLSVGHIKVLSQLSICMQVTAPRQNVRLSVSQLYIKYIYIFIYFF